jgi:heptosyltransferase-1
MAAAVEAASAGHARALPVTSLGELAALMRDAAVVLGGDTGPIHLAHALGAPVLCLMGPTDPDKSGPYGAPESALWHRLPCSFCHQRLDDTKACLLEISPSRVAERATALVRAPW